MNTSLRDVFTKVYKQIRNCYDRLGKQLEGFKIYYDSLAIVRNVFSQHRKGIGICYDRFGKQREGCGIYSDSFAIVRDLFLFHRKVNRIYYSASPNHRKLLERLCNPFAFSYERLQIVYDSLVTLRELFCFVDEVLERHCDR